MKQPTKLKRDFKEIVSSHGLNANDYMLIKETEFYLYLISKDGKTRKTVDKFKRKGKRYV